MGIIRGNETMKSNNQPAVEVSELTKRYGEVLAVDDISFRVGQGELFGFLGPNGAGKTTTINMLTGLARLDAGTVNIGAVVIRVPPLITMLDDLGSVNGFKRINATDEPFRGI